MLQPVDTGGAYAMLCLPPWCFASCCSAPCGETPVAAMPGVTQEPLVWALLCVGSWRAAAELSRTVPVPHGLWCRLQPSWEAPSWSLVSSTAPSRAALGCKLPAGLDASS